MAGEAEGSRRTRRVAPVEEAAIRIAVDGLPDGCLTCTPADLRELAAGWLVGAGIIRGGGEIEEIEVPEGDARPGFSEVWRLAVRLGTPTATHGRGCGPLEALRLAGLTAPRRGEASLPAPERLASLLRELFDAGERSRETGGFHAAALCDADGLRRVFEDVSRHAAVDKAIGSGVLDGVDLDGCGLVLSARISGEIALKAARAGLAWVASRSVPTTLAVAIAEEGGVTLVARAASPEARIFGAGA